MPLMVRFTSTLIAACALSVVFTFPASAVEGTWQVGLNLGISRLTPETDSAVFTLVDDQSTLSGAYLSFDITPTVAAVIALTDLGEAMLSQNQSISYRSLSVGSTLYMWGDADVDRRANGASGFLRFGLSAIDNDSDVRLTRANNSAFWLTAGLQFPLSEQWGLRAELTSYDGDAQAALAGVYWRVGRSGKSDSRHLTTGSGSESESGDQSVAAEPVLATPGIASKPGSQPAPDASQESESEAERADGSDQTIAPARKSAGEAECSADLAARFSDPSACVVLNSILYDLQFSVDSATIEPGSAESLDLIVAALKQNPDLVTEIRAHVQSSGDAQTDTRIATQRARSVARYLVQNGVPLAQLRARAFGATVPLANSREPAAQRLNNRIELRSQ